MAKPNTFDAETRAAFLLALERLGELGPAAAAAGVSEPTVWRYRAKHPEFEEECAAALNRLGGDLLGVARLIGIKGLVEKSYDKDGNLIREKTTYDTRVLLKWLARLYPDQWGDKIAVDQTTRQAAPEREATKPERIPAEARAKLRDALDAIRSN